MIHKQPSSPHRHPHGAILVVVLLTLVVILGLMGSLSQLSVMQHNESRRFEIQAQADWLAESAADRAANRFAISEFSTDTWTVSLAELGTVQIVTRAILLESPQSSGRLESHVRLDPGFTRTPIHGHATRQLEPKRPARTGQTPQTQSNRPTHTE